MPKYDFYCDVCDDQYELELSFDKVTLTVTCVCNNPMRRIYTSNPVHFKGDGWAGKKQ